jgi:hypothetical protein
LVYLLGYNECCPYSVELVVVLHIQTFVRLFSTKGLTLPWWITEKAMFGLKWPINATTYFIPCSIIATITNILPESRGREYPKSEGKLPEN